MDKTIIILFEKLNYSTAFFPVIKSCVPNITHITQPTNQNYGLFKTMYWSNLQVLTKHITSITPTAIPLLVLGGNSKNKDDRLILCELPPMFDEAFSFDRDQEVWKELGFFPLTRTYLLDTKVRHKVVVLMVGRTYHWSWSWSTNACANGIWKGRK